MKRIVASIALLCLLAFPAFAGTIVITIMTAGAPCNGGICTKTYMDTDVNLGKIVSTYQSGCNTSINAVCTSLQVMKFWADQMVATTVQAVTANDVQALQAAAAASYTPIKPQ